MGCVKKSGTKDDSTKISKVKQIAIRGSGGVTCHKCFIKVIKAQQSQMNGCQYSGCLTYLCCLCLHCCDIPRHRGLVKLRKCGTRIYPKLGQRKGTQAPKLDIGSVLSS